MKAIVMKVLSAAALLALAACSPPAGQDAAVTMSAHEIGDISDAVSKAHALEVKAMQAHPGFATREGDTLTINLNGRPAAKMADTILPNCLNGDCSTWTFRGVENLQTATGIDPNAVVTYEDEKGWLHVSFIGDDRALTWFDNWPKVSPGGQYIASGSREGQDVTGEFQITDWATPYPHTVYVFDVGCDVGEWRSEREVAVTCDHPAGYATPATVALFGDNEWRLTTDEHRTPDGKKIKAPVLFPKVTRPTKGETYGLTWFYRAP